jgi:hypothetical protein
MADPIKGSALLLFLVLPNALQNADVAAGDGSHLAIPFLKV